MISRKLPIDPKMVVATPYTMQHQLAIQCLDHLAGSLIIKYMAEGIVNVVGPKAIEPISPIMSIKNGSEMATKAVKVVYRLR